MKQKTSRRQFLKTTSVGAVLTGLSVVGCRHTDGACPGINVSRDGSSKRTERPNILWIVGENLKLDLGCYGAKNVHTPNLDGLAANGMRYTHTFATSPVCAPSRSAFFVGMYQTTSDTHNMRSHRNDDYRLPEGVRPITHRLKEVGYFTANVKTIGEEVVGSGKLDLNFVNEGKLYNGDRWEDLKTHQPFFAQVNTLEAEYDIYDRQTWRYPRVEWKGERTHEKIATPESVIPPPYYPDHPIVREEWARYLNSISGMDKTFGRILEQLKVDGLADNTIVMFFGDNGRIEPRGIHWCYDTGIHVPLIVHIPKNVAKPGNYRPGTVSDEVISLIDITPTTLSFAGIERPKGMDGRIFLGDQLTPEREYAFSARDRIDETANRIRSVRGKRYHYIRNYYPDRHFTSLNRYKEKCFPIKPLMRKLMAEGKLTGPVAELMSPEVAPEQLFDTINDPHEIHNLADSKEPEHREALIRMRAALSVWIVETQDQGVFPEPQDVVEPFEKEMHDWFGTPDWYKK
ncbi:MAG: sulfatase family protein [Planctomycetota bacterium]